MERICRARDLNGYVWANVAFYARNTQPRQRPRGEADSRFASAALTATAPPQPSQPGRMQKSLDDHVGLMKA
ncbi:hypothetical protein [Bradyrhizobium sp.]|uniref:hypothetical protein n=1 Tax=Bradyrhizobium sp. TaxID=376 RepID=UPI0026218779|nr:hypothetical protein [Bradyrhizobium sp.]